MTSLPTEDRFAQPSQGLTPSVSFTPTFPGTQTKNTEKSSVISPSQTHPALIQAAKLLNIPSSSPPATLTSHRYEQIKLKPEVEKLLNPAQKARLLELGEKADEDFSKEIDGEIVRPFDIPKESFFKNCDLKIFPDSYEGRLPNNGIKQADFTKLEKLREDIQNGRGIFNIDEKSLVKVQGFLDKLLLMKTGRTLLMGLTAQGNKIQIREGEESHIRLLTSDEKSDKEGEVFEVVVCLDDKDDHFYNTMGPDGIKTTQKFTPLGLLYHELSHALIDPLETWKVHYAPLSGKLFDDFHKETELRNIVGAPIALAVDLQKQTEEFAQEESQAEMNKIKLVISGTSAQFNEFQERISQEHKAAADKMKGEKEMNEKIDYNKSPLNQSLEELEADFRSYDESPEKEIPTFENLFNVEINQANKNLNHRGVVRIDHGGLTKPTNLKLTHPISSKILEYLYTITSGGYVNEIKEFFEINKDLSGKPLLKFAMDSCIKNLFDNKNLIGLKALFLAKVLPLDYQVDSEVQGSDTRISQNLFQMAASRGFLQGLKYLMTMPNAKQYINSTNSKGETLIHLTFYRNEIDEELVKFLLWIGVDPNQKNNDGYTALDYASAENHFELLPLLTSQKNRISDKPIGIDKPAGLKLLLIENKGNVEALQKLIESGTLPLNSLIDSKNILQFFVENGLVKETEFLLSMPAGRKFIDQIDSNGNTALHLAMNIQDDHKDVRDAIIELLLPHSLEPFKSNSDGISPLQLAITKGQKEVFFKFIKQFGPDHYLSVFKNVIDAAQGEYLEILIKGSPSRKSSEEAALHAAGQGNIDTIKKLFTNLNSQYGKDALLIKDSDNKSLLYKILENTKISPDNKAELVDYFMKNGLPPLSEKTNYGVSVLQLAMKRDLKNIFSLLISELDTDEYMKALDTFDNANNEYVAILIKNTRSKVQLDEAALYAAVNWDKDKIKLVLKQLSTKYAGEEEFLIKDKNGENLLHKLLVNNKISPVTKAQFANYLIKNGVVPSENSHEGEGSSFDDICPANLKEAMALLKQRQEVKKQISEMKRKAKQRS